MSAALYRLLIVFTCMSFSTSIFAAENTSDATVANEKPAAPIIRGGMKFIPLDRKKAVVRPISKNQPAIIRPRSTVITRTNAKSFYKEKELKENPTNSDTDSSGSENPVLSIFTPEHSGTP